MKSAQATPPEAQSKAARRRGTRDWWKLALAALPGLAALQRLREEAEHFQDPFELARHVLRELGTHLQIPQGEIEHIPESGATVIVANHPFGGLDGLSAIAAVGQRRRDLRVLANPELTQIGGLGSVMIPIDPFGGLGATRENIAGLRSALRWLAGGGALLVFPAGEVSHLDVRSWSVTDPPWNTTAARLLRRSGAIAVPMYFAGSNSALFQVAGMLHPRLRTLLLPGELANKSGACVRARVGEAMSAARLSSFESDELLCAHLRLKTYALSREPATPSVPPARELAPIVDPVDPQILAREIAALPEQAILASSGHMRVYCAPAASIPWVLQELGRLREVTFRAAGEGTGRSADIDVFDDYYEHLFIWNTERREIVGAYRLGRTDEIARRFGKRGLYTATLFDYNDLFLTLLGPALELGRSFVRVEYQKSFAALLLLWKGIGERVSREPRYCRLIGPVSISNDYRPVSRELLVGFLRRHNFDLLAPAVVRPKRPFRGKFSLRSLSGAPTARDLEALSAIVGGLEPDGKGAPVLLRQYLKLGGRILGFSVDPQFGNALDCLVLVDLRKTNPQVLRKYMSEEGWQRFASRHRPRQLSGRPRPLRVGPARPQESPDAPKRRRAASRSHPTR
jgi:putative hemolysin